MAVELIVPSVGESITEVEIGDWLKKQGETVDQDEPVVVIETDKVSVELPALTAGTITKLLKQSGTFTISNGGIYGSMLSTPIVNPPQSGVLGLHAIEDRPVAVDGKVVIRPMMYLALTYDHRIVDGREAVMFLKHIKEDIEEPSRLFQ